MTKKQVVAVDYSKLSLADVIKLKTKKVSFLELKLDEKRSVLKYIKKYKIDLKVFGHKWYDVLSNKFYAEEYLLSNELFLGMTKKVMVFDTFSDFFSYVRGDIYENSCFYGYVFSSDIKKKFSIDLEKLNFDSFIEETIDSYTFESIRSVSSIDAEILSKRVQNINKWFQKIKQINTLEDLEKKYHAFISRFNFSEAKNVFASMILRKNKKFVKKAAIRFVCKHDTYEGITFDKILVTYGNKAAQYVIENYKMDDMMSYSTQRKRIRQFKNSFEAFENGTFMLTRKSEFKSGLQLYYVNDKYHNKTNYSIRDENYFDTFEEFASFLGGDLSGADLSLAPLSKEDVLKYKIDSETKLPFAKQFSTYELKKRSIDDGFIIKQKWLDSEGIVILTKEHKFKHFFDFVHFLKGDLSGADCLLCDGIENIKNISGLTLSGVHIRSEIAEKLRLATKNLPDNAFPIKSFEQIKKYEIATIEGLLTERSKDEDYSFEASYITDIHLLHRFDAYKCKTVDDVNYVIRTIAKRIAEQATGVTLIGGDTSSSIEVFKDFVCSLSKYRKRGEFFFVLGNHELWGQPKDGFDVIVSKYKKILEEYGKGHMHLIQNSLFYADNGWKEISEKELFKISKEDLRVRMRSANLIIFGGVGFAGYNEEFNAKNGIYENVISRDCEREESTKFLTLHNKVTDALKGKNIIILTHMPMKDWGGTDMHAEEEIVYINGHSHRNYFYDDGKKRIYADNQVGYHGKRLSLKQVAIDFNFDWFADYEDGIHEISKFDYEKFYRGIGEGLTFNRQYEKLYLIKREGTYMFLMQASKGNMLILNGGSIRRAGNHPLEYFYENIVKYSKSVRIFLSKYDELQKHVSTEVKKIGGDGTIHGSIVDIDFYNHLYINPLDGTITPYFAYSMVNKYVYDNIPSLLKYECSKLFVNYQKLIERQRSEESLIIRNQNLSISKKKHYVDSTEMYRVSRIIKGLQFTTKYNIVKLWNDRIVTDASEENGRMIVSNLINLDSMPAEAVEIQPKEIKEPKSSVLKPALNEEEKPR